MKRTVLLERIGRLEKSYEDYKYSLCESVQDFVNFKQNFTPLLDTTRVFFFEKYNLMVLVDEPNDYKKAFPTPSEGLKEIKSWFNTIVLEEQLREEEIENQEREEKEFC